MSKPTAPTTTPTQPPVDRGGYTSYNKVSYTVTKWIHKLGQVDQQGSCGYTKDTVQNLIVERMNGHPMGGTAVWDREGLPPLITM